MTTDDLLTLLDFEPELCDAEILSQEPLRHNATFILARLKYTVGDITVPLIHFDGCDWIFSPWDWQEELPTTPDGIDTIKWRVDDTEQEGLIFDGIPMLAPWVDDIKNVTRETRCRIGQRLKDARIAQNISVRALAIQSGVDKSSICRIEAGRLNAGIDNLTRLADILGLQLVLIDA